MMKIDFRDERIFWAAIGICAAALLCLFFFWALPAHWDAVQTEREWNQIAMEISGLESLLQDIPSRATLENGKKYRTALDKQATAVQTYFTDRANLLDAPLRGEGGNDPGAFKDSYISARGSQIDLLNRNKSRMQVSDVDNAFVNYPWIRDARAPGPKPEQYKSILRGYWVRFYLYQCFLKAQVRVVRKVEVVPEVVSLGTGMQGIPVRADLSVAPALLKDLVEKLLTLSPSANEPVFMLNSMSVRAEPGTGNNENLCAVHLDMHILLFNQPAPPKAAPAVEKRPDAKAN